MACHHPRQRRIVAKPAVSAESPRAALWLPAGDRQLLTAGYRLLNTPPPRLAFSTEPRRSIYPGRAPLIYRPAIGKTCGRMTMATRVLNCPNPTHATPPSPRPHLDDLGWGGGAERRPAREHLISHHSRAPHVHPAVVPRYGRVFHVKRALLERAIQYLGGEVAARAGKRSRK